MRLDKGVRTFATIITITITTKHHPPTSNFTQIYTPLLIKLISHMKPAAYSLDFIHNKFLEEVINTVGPSNVFFGL